MGGTLGGQNGKGSNPRDPFRQVSKKTFNLNWDRCFSGDKKTKDRCGWIETSRGWKKIIKKHLTNKTCSKYNCCKKGKKHDKENSKEQKERSRCGQVSKCPTCCKG